MFKPCSAWSETRNSNNSVCQHFSWLSKPLCYKKKPTKKQKKPTKKQHKKHKLLFTGKGTASGNLFHLTLNISKSIWQFLQTFNHCTQKPLWSFADWGITLWVDAQRAIHRATKCTPRHWELSSHPPSVHVRAEEKLLQAIWLREGVCELISESLNSGWLSSLFQAAALQPLEPCIRCRREKLLPVPLLLSGRRSPTLLCYDPESPFLTGTSQRWKWDF